MVRVIHFPEIASIAVIPILSSKMIAVLVGATHKVLSIVTLNSLVPSVTLLSS
jgi:hypothetical protein